MKKALFAAASAITILASGSVSAQTTMNAPYYANPSWDQTLPAAQRFIVLSNMNNAAVLDRETGLVWEEAPNQNPSLTWSAARLYCTNKTLGSRKGWRLPTVDELSSLYNTSGSGLSGGLPGSPFVSPILTSYWSSTVFLDDFGEPNEQPEVGVNFAQAYIVSFTIGLADGAFTQSTLSKFGAWCVRGSSAGNAQ
jgi:hypothetical protein